MSSIEIDIQDEDNGGEVWLRLLTSAVSEDGAFAVLDMQAADLVRDILVHRRAGHYEFSPLDVNG